MKITIITLFPNQIQETLNTSMLKRAQKKGLIDYQIVDLREFGEGVHKIVDGRPYGGGPGMLFRADILAKALKSVYSLPSTAKIEKQKSEVGSRIVLTSASGIPFKQSKAQELSKIDHLIIICGHYEGVDQRFIEKYVDEEISIGDYVLTGGELPALVITDAITRLIPGVLNKEEATIDESFAENLLEHPQYTRPEVFEGLSVPEILLSGHHGKVEAWRKEKSVEKTTKTRPDILKK